MKYNEYSEETRREAFDLYENSVTDAIQKMDENDATGSDLYTAITGLGHLDAYADPEGQRALPELVTRADSLTTEFWEAVDEPNHSFPQSLVSPIKDDTRRLPKSVWIAVSLTPVGMETDNVLVPRDSIGFVDEFVDEEFLPERTRGRIEGLDAVLFSKYQKNVEKHQSEIEVFSKPYLPSSFWWRHPEQFLPDQQLQVRLWHQQQPVSDGDDAERIDERIGTFAATDTVCLRHDELDDSTEDDLRIRDEIEVALRRLPDGAVGERTLGRLEGVDAALYKKLDSRAGQWYTHDDLSRISEPDLPESFWWRHPEQFLYINEGPRVSMWYEREAESD